MKISVVTISYNQKKYVEATIDSVLMQADVNFEYIIIDPGSSDGSIDVINKYKDKVDKIIIEPDFGPSDGLNKGLNFASGDIFCYINSDDLLLPGALSRVKKLFEDNPDIDIIYGDGIIIDENGKKKRECYSDVFDIKAAAYGASIVIQPSTFFRMSIFRKNVKFNINNKSNWDGELFIDAVLAGAKIKNDKHLYSAYRVHGDGITGSGRLAEKHANHALNMFYKIMKRNFGPMDKLLSELYRVRKHIINPRALIERIKFGPIYGNSKS